MVEILNRLSKAKGFKGLSRGVVSQPGLRALARDQRGVIIVMFALMLPLMLGFIGLGVEVGYWFQKKRELQTAADAAAVASSYEVYEGRSSGVQTIAEREAVNNGWNSTDGTITVRSFPFNATFPASGSFTADTAAVEIELTYSLTRLFSSFFVSGNLTLNARAVGTTSSSGNACILSLNASDPSAIKASGTVNLSLQSCGIAVTSTDSTKALDLPGTVTVDSEEICVGGGVSTGGNVTFVDASPTTDCTPPSDPLSTLAEPPEAETPVTCEFGTGTDPKVISDTNNPNITLSAGVYCGGITISGSGNTITFGAGTYILAGGGLKVSGGNNTLDGTSGVFFYNTDKDDDGSFGDIDFSGASTANLTAPSSGDYAGMLFFMDRSAAAVAAGKKFKIAGTVTTNFDGVIYSPGNEVEFSGTASQSQSCGAKIIADKVTLNGTVGVFGGGSGCASSKVSIGTSTIVGLVE